MDDPTPEQYEAIVQKHVTALREWFPHVQILVSHETDDGCTGNLFLGAGNWFCRKGMAMSFLESDNARTIAHEMPRPKPPPPEDDGESWKHTS